MIRSFACRDTERLAARNRVRRFVNFERVALRKLAMLDAAAVLEDLRVPPGNRLEALKGDRAGNTRSGSMTSIGFALSGRRTAPMTSKSSTTTETGIDRLAPVHPGEVLSQEFLEPLGLSANALARRIGVPGNRVSMIVAGKRG
jgi:plasmid maintenance system killer protein